ncbi:MAG: hypothetical protein ACJA01_003557, partial [Saprospiraceae bacterium]
DQERGLGTKHPMKFLRKYWTIKCTLHLLVESRHRNTQASRLSKQNE